MDVTTPTLTTEMLATIIVVIDGTQMLITILETGNHIIYSFRKDTR